MSLSHEYIHHRLGYRFGTRCCWIRIYEGEPGDAPVVVCEEIVGVSGMSEYLAAEVIREHFPGALPDLPRPLLWIEHRRARKRGPGRYALLTFPSYAPRPEGVGFTRRVTLGPPRREPLAPYEVATLTGGEVWSP